MPTGWSRANVAHQLQTAISKVGRGRAAGRTCSARQWRLRPPARDILSMYVIFKENTLMKPMIALLIAVALTLAGCNTVRGMCQDIEKAGDSIQKATHYMQAFTVLDWLLSPHDRANVDTDAIIP